MIEGQQIPEGVDTHYEAPLYGAIVSVPYHTIKLHHI